MNTKTLLRTQMSVAKKRKRKFRVMTFGEFCHKHRFCKQCPMYDNRIYGCITPYFESNDPFRTKNGKYILIEVTNDA